MRLPMSELNTIIDRERASPSIADCGHHRMNKGKINEMCHFCFRAHYMTCTSSPDRRLSQASRFTFILMAARNHHSCQNLQ